MRRRNNTHFQIQEPKEIDRFKKRTAPRILFAEEVNYSMTINDQNETIQKKSESSNNSVSSQTKQQNQFGQYSLEQNTTQQRKVMRQKVSKEEKAATLEMLTKKQQPQQLESLSPESKEKQAVKSGDTKRQVVIIGQAVMYEEKTKGFKKGMRRRYSHKNEADYMTY